MVAARREKILELFDSGKRPQEIAKKRKISTSTVYTTLRRAGRTVRHMQLPVTAFNILADLLNTGDSHKKIGERQKVSRQRVQQVATEARKAGIKLRGGVRA